MSMTMNIEFTVIRDAKRAVLEPNFILIESVKPWVVLEQFKLW